MSRPTPKPLRTSRSPCYWPRDTQSSSHPASDLLPGLSAEEPKEFVGSAMDCSLCRLIAALHRGSEWSAQPPLRSGSTMSASSRRVPPIPSWYFRSKIVRKYLCASASTDLTASSSSIWRILVERREPPLRQHCERNSCCLRCHDGVWTRVTRAHRPGPKLNGMWRPQNSHSHMLHA